MTKFDEYKERFISQNVISDLREDHLVFFVLFFVEIYCLHFCKRVKKQGAGRPPFVLKNMLALVLYSEFDREFSPKKIAQLTRDSTSYKLIMEGVPVSKESFIRYKSYFMAYGEEILAATVQLAKDFKLSAFDTVSVDGTKIKAYCSPFKVIRKSDLRKLIKILKGEESSDEVKNLKRTTRKFYYNDKMTIAEKLALLIEMERQLKICGQKTISVSDMEARWMYNKKGKAELSYNLQTCVDTATHLILATFISQNPTDDYDLPIVANKAMNNLDMKIIRLLADAGYSNELVIQYLKTQGIDGYIQNATESRKDKGNSKINPSSKDNVYINYEEGFIICFAGEIFAKSYTYDEEVTKETPFGEIKRPPKIKKLFTNTEACKNCFYKEYCLSEKSDHRTYTIYGSQDYIDMILKMQTPEAKEIYKLRPTVESPYGTMKQFYELNQIPYIGKFKMQGIVNLKSAVFNLKRIANLILHELLFSDEQYINFVHQKIADYTPQI